MFCVMALLDVSVFVLFASSSQEEHTAFFCESVAPSNSWIPVPVPEDGCFSRILKGFLVSSFFLRKKDLTG